MSLLNLQCFRSVNTYILYCEFFFKVSSVPSILLFTAPDYSIYQFNCTCGCLLEVVCWSLLGSVYQFYCSCGCLVEFVWLIVSNFAYRNYFSPVGGTRAQSSLFVSQLYTKSSTQLHPVSVENNVPQSTATS